MMIMFIITFNIIYSYDSCAAVEKEWKKTSNKELNKSEGDSCTERAVLPITCSLISITILLTYFDEEVVEMK